MINKKQKGIVTKIVPVTGMMCAVCAGAVDKIVSELEGVIDVEVNLATATMTVSYESSKTNLNCLKEILKKSGYDLIIVEDKKSALEEQDKIENIINGYNKKIIIQNKLIKINNELEAKEKIELIKNEYKNFGIHGEEGVFYAGGNAKMNEFQAAMGICNLRHLDNEIQKRKRIVEHYRKRLSDAEGIKLSAIQEYVESNYAYFPVVFDKYKYTRNEIFEKLKQHNIVARKYFYPLTNSFECYCNYSTAGVEKTPVAQYIALRVLTLPLYPDLSVDIVDEICDLILND